LAAACIRGCQWSPFSYRQIPSNFSVHDVQPLSSTNFNTSHRIRHLSFGKNIPGKTNPIDGTDVIAHEGKTPFGCSVVLANYRNKQELQVHTRQK
jgi:hypothetical protein